MILPVCRTVVVVYVFLRACVFCLKAKFGISVRVHGLEFGFDLNAESFRSRVSGYEFVFRVERNVFWQSRKTVITGGTDPPDTAAMMELQEGSADTYRLQDTTTIQSVSRRKGAAIQQGPWSRTWMSKVQSKSSLTEFKRDLLCHS